MAQSGLDINVSHQLSSSGFPQSFLSAPSPSYSTGMDLNSHQQQNMASLAGSNSNNNNASVSSHRLCQLLTQNTAPEHLHSPASVDGRRSARGHQVAGQIGSALTPNSVSSTNTALASSSVGMASLGMDLHRPGSSNSAMKSPDDHLHQSPTEGPGQSPPQKPQSTSNEDGEMEITNVTGIGSSSICSQSSGNARGSGGGSGSSSSMNSSGGVGGGTNYILKTLLSQDDDDEPSMLEPSISSPPISSAGHSGSSSDFHGLGEKNEAEPRKPNALLKVSSNSCFVTVSKLCNAGDNFLSLMVMYPVCCVREQCHH